MLLRPVNQSTNSCSHAGVVGFQCMHTCFLEFALDWLEDCQIITSRNMHNTIHENCQLS